MKRYSQDTTNKVIRALDLPQDIFLGLPNISMIGNKEIYISNHKGILSYGQEEICILIKDYQMQVKGRALSICSYTKEDLTIQGYIHSLEFI